MIMVKTFATMFEKEFVMTPSQLLVDLKIIVMSNPLKSLSKIHANRQ